MRLAGDLHSRITLGIRGINCKSTSNKVLVVLNGINLEYNTNSIILLHFTKQKADTYFILRTKDKLTSGHHQLKVKLIIQKVRYLKHIPLYSISGGLLHSLLVPQYSFSLLLFDFPRYFINLLG